MDSQVAIAAITIIPPTLAIIGSSFRGQRSRQKHADVAEQKLAANAQKLDGIHILVNGRLDEALSRVRHLEQTFGTTTKVIDSQEDK